jgi:hypothetical protein
MKTLQRYFNRGEFSKSNKIIQNFTGFDLEELGENYSHKMTRPSKKKALSLTSLVLLNQVTPIYPALKNNH